MDNPGNSLRVASRETGKCFGAGRVALTLILGFLQSKSLTLGDPGDLMAGIKDSKSLCISGLPAQNKHILLIGSILKRFHWFIGMNIGAKTDCDGEE